MERKTYQLFADFWPTASTKQEVIADKLNKINKVVFFNTLKKAPWGEWKEAAVIAGDPLSAIRQLKALPGKNIVIWGSISLAQSLMNENLIDEYRIQLCPVLTGGGRSRSSQQMNFQQLSL